MISWIATLALMYSGGVTLREREASPSGQVTAVKLDGVEVTDSTQVSELSWDRVAAVDGEFAAKAEEFKGLSEQLWRARKRMERGDLVLAEPSLEALATEYPTLSGPTGMLLHSARVSCRLLRGAQVGALEPYAKFLTCISDEELRGVRNRPVLKGLDAMPPRARPAGLLVADFPPMWLDVPSLRIVLDFNPDLKSPQVLAIVKLYTAAARFETNQSSESTVSAEIAALKAIDAGDDGDLLKEIVTARAGNKEQRTAARDALTKRIKPGMEEWRESWVRVGIGRSLVRESTVDEKLAGVAEMLHAPARFSHATPYVAGLALAECAVTLREISDRAEADRLVADLREKFARHPALEYRPIREWHLATLRPAAPVEPSPIIPSPTPVEGGPK